MGAFTDGVVASLAPWNDPDGHWVNFNTALAAMFEPIAQLVMPQGSPDEPESYRAGWSTLLDPTVCPDAYLPYCAQFVGITIPSGTSAAAARAIIQAEQGFSSGQGYSGNYTTANGADGGAIVLAAQLWLSGSQSCVLLERTAADGTTADPYHFVLIVMPEQVIDAGQLAAAVTAVKPVGVQWTLIQADGTTWAEATHTWAAETATWDQAAAIDP